MKSWITTLAVSGATFAGLSFAPIPDGDTALALDTALLAVSLVAAIVSGCVVAHRLDNGNY